MQMLRRSIACLLLVWFVPACSTYQTTDLAPQQAISGQKAVKVILANAASTEVTVREPWVRADSIGGVMRLCRRSGCDVNPTWSVPLSAVAEVKTKRFSGGLTAAVTAGGVAVLGAIILVLVNSEWG